MSTKVFVGNLAFKTKPETLKEEFEAAGAVVTANIITRGPRSLGYGFVEFSTAEAAENAVKLLNQKEVDGRTINVEVAKPREETPAGEGAASAGGAEGEKAGAPARGPRAPRPRRQFNTNNNANTNTNAGGSPSGNGGAPRRAYRPRTYSDNKQEGEAGSGSPQQQGQRPPRRGYNQGGQQQQQQGGGFQQGGRRPFRPRNNTNGAQGGQTQQQQGGNPRPPRQFQQKPQAPRPQTERKPSETTLFVANLPFAVDDAELKEIFSGFKVATAHVVTKRNGRSKGFGFVTFETHEDQQAALAAKDNQTYKERLLNVKVALVNQTGQPVAEGEGEKAADAPAADVPATEEKAPATEEAKPAETKPEEKSA